MVRRTEDRRVSYGGASQQFEEVLVQRRRTAVEELQPLCPVQTGGGPSGGAASLPALLHVQHGGQQSSRELLQLLLQHQQEAAAGRT